MNKFKKSFIEAANKQDIHNLTDKILSNVDQSKVVVSPASKEVYRLRPSFKIAGVTGLIATLSCACIALSVALITNTDKNDKVIDDDGTPITIDDGKRFVAEEITDEFIINSYGQEVSTLTNIAMVFDDIKFDDVELLDTKRMSESEEIALVNDLDSYMLSIEEMLGYINVSYTCTINNNTSYSDYDYDLKIVYPNKVYDFFFNDEITNTKNAGTEKAKVDSDINGIMVGNGHVYNVTGNKRVQATSIEFNMKIEISPEYYITVREDLGEDQNYYRYEYYNSSNELIKVIDIDERTAKIDFRNDWDKVVITPNEDKTINCKIKSRDGDSIKISKEYAYNYQFKNSQHLYVKNLK